MATVYCYSVKLSIADLIRTKSIIIMLKDSVQPYNKPIIDPAFSVCNVKYQTFVFFACTSLLRRSVHTKNLSLIFHSTD